MKYLKLLILLFVAPLFSGAQTPELNTHTLANGVKVYFLKYGKIDAMHISVMVGSGKKNEAPGQQGYNSMVATLLLKGNTRFKMEEQNDRLFAIGADVDVEAGYDYTGLSANVLSKDADEVLTLLSAAIKEPLFEKEMVDQHLSILRNYNQADKMDIGQIASIYSGYVIHGKESPFGRHLNKNQLKATTVEKIKEFHQFNFIPKNTHIVVCGNFKNKDVLGLIEKHFGNWQSTYNSLNSVSFDQPRIKKRELYFANRTAATQTALQWNFKAPSIKDKDYLSFVIANQIFNQILFKEIREKGGKTYNISSMPLNTQNTDLLIVRSSVRSEEVNNTIALFDKTLNDFNNGGFTQEEFTNEITRFKTHLMAIEFPDEIIEFYNPVIYDFKKREKLLKDVEKIKMEDVKKVIQRYFVPESYKLVIAGDEKILQTQLAGIKGLKKLGVKDLE